MGLRFGILAMNNNVPKVQLVIVLVSIAYFSTASAGFSALYGGVISLVNTVLIDKHINKKNNATISAQAIVVMMVVSTVLRMAMVVGLISIGVFVLELNASVLVVSLVLGICGFLIDRVIRK